MNIAHGEEQIKTRKIKFSSDSNDSNPKTTTTNRMYRFILCALVLFCLSTGRLKAQQKPEVSTTLTGAPILSTDGKSVFLNMGGPAIKVSFKKWFAAFNMFPSLRFFDVNGTINVNPILGTGPTIGYKRWVIGFPCYYLTKDNIWVLTVGVGVRLGK